MIPRHGIPIGQAGVPGDSQERRRLGHVRQSGHHGTAADGRPRARAWHPVRARAAGGGGHRDGRRLRAGARRTRGGERARLAGTRVAPRLVVDRAAIDAAAKRLVAATSPLIVAGDAVAHSDALAELVELAELIGAPVMLEGVSSTCSFPFTHPLYAGSMPRLGPGIKALLMRHDLLFSVGGDLFTLSLPSDVDPMPPGLDVVHLDVDPWELGKNYPAAIAIQGDPKASLPELGEAVRRLTSKEGHPDAPRRRGAVRAAWESERAELARRAEA